LAADYRFQGTLGSDVGAPPALANLGSGNRFVTERVDGAERSVLAFAAGDGLSLTPTTDIIANDTYTVVLLFRFETVDGYRRILDTKNGAIDRGLYNLGGQLMFYNDATAPTATIAASSYVQVVLTRTAAGVTVGYVDGAQQFSFTDAGGNGTVSSDNVLRFFKDDGAENSAGAVARIRLYNRALSADEVARLDRLP
jgi:hypothetical protein